MLIPSYLYNITLFQFHIVVWNNLTSHFKLSTFIITNPIAKINKISNLFILNIDYPNSKSNFLWKLIYWKSKSKLISKNMSSKNIHWPCRYNLILFTFDTFRMIRGKKNPIINMRKSWVLWLLWLLLCKHNFNTNFWLFFHITFIILSEQLQTIPTIFYQN